MIRALLGAILLALPFAATGQKTARPEAAEDQRNIERFDVVPGLGLVGDFIGTRDSDRFESRRVQLGALTRFDSPYSFVAVGAGTHYFKQDDWSKRGYSIFGHVEERDRATGGGISAGLSWTRINDHDHLLGEILWNKRFSTRTGMEAFLQRDVVESRPAIEAGVTHAFLGASVDHSFTERFTGIALAGAQRFSDGNDRTHLRGWLIYTLLPEYGFGVQARARAYENSQRGGAFYFNPENYENADIGLRMRKGFGPWRVYAFVAAGNERIDHSSTHPTRFAQLNVDRVFARDIRVGFRYAYSRAAGEDTGLVGNPDYAWRYLRFFIVAPL